MNDTPDPWANEAGEEPLEEAHQEDVVDEALVVDASGDHGANTGRHGDAVEDTADQCWCVLE